VIGVLALVSGAYANGCIVLGVGLIIVGVGGATANISFLQIKVTGPIGLILIVFGIFFDYVTGV